MDARVSSDTDHQRESFCENWMLQLDRDDRMSLGVFLIHNLKAHMGKGETEAAELAGMMVSDVCGYLTTAVATHVYRKMPWM